MKLLTTLLFFLCFGISVSAQTTQNARALRSGTANPNSSALPCKIGPNYTDKYLRTTDHSEWTCTGVSTWTQVVSGGTPISGSGISGRVAFWDSTSSITGDSDLTFATDTLTFTKGVASTNLTTPIIKPSANSTTAVQFTKADGTTVIATVDSNNLRIGINVTPLATFHVQADGDVIGSFQNYQIRVTGNTHPTRGLFLGLDDTNTLGAIQVFDIGTGVGNLVLNQFGGKILVGTTTDAGYLLDVAGSTRASSYNTATNCSDSAGAAACGSATAGSFVIDASTTSVVVSTTAVTANSQIFVQEDSSLSTRLGIACNTQSILILGTPVITARTSGTSFTVTIVTGPTSTPMCLSYHIVN